MKKLWWKSIFMFFIVGSLFTCIDPYNPNLGKYESVLVVDALITDENTSNYVRISRTMETSEEEPVMITGAEVVIKDDLGASFALTETYDGVYKTDSLTFRGEIGRIYTLNIKTSDGSEYNSDGCLMSPVQDIDTISYKKDEEIIDNEIKGGLRIYVKSKSTTECAYNRWTYREWWKVEATYAQQWVYIDSITYVPYIPYKRFCYANKKSGDIIINSTEEDIDQPILFVASEDSPRLLVQYCLELRQLSLSKEEYGFWECMKQIEGSGGDLFDKQPFQIKGNIHNINKPEQTVLGYFQVSAVKMKREYITYRQAKDAGVTRYIYPCEVIKAIPDKVMTSWDKVYHYYTGLGYTFVLPVLCPGGICGLVFVTPLCGDCTLTGTLAKPDFWIDLE
jgi:hypothetical protein